MYIRAVSSAFPKYLVTPEDVKLAAQEWLGKDSDQLEVFLRYLKSSHALERHFVRPALEIVRLAGPKARAAIFEKEASALALDASLQALEASAVSANDIDAIIFTSCTCPAIPSIDTYLVDQLGLKRDLVRIPAYQFGCAGGIIGIGLAQKLSATCENILLVSAELCSLIFQRSDCTAAQLVGASLFADGAAALVLSNKRLKDGIKILKHSSYLLPESRHLMGYEICDDGPHLLLDKNLPQSLAHEIPKLVDQFLSNNSLKRSEVAWWLFHPGGAKILDLLSNTLGLDSSQCHWAADVLYGLGNMSSATILCVIQQFLNQKVAKQGDQLVMVGVGPGLTIEMILAQQIL